MGHRGEPSAHATDPHLQALLEDLPIVLWVVDADGIFTLSEGRGLGGLGLAPGEVVGQSVFELYRDVPEIVAGIRRGLGGEDLHTTAAVAELVWETHLIPRRGENDVVTGLYGLSVDVTETRRAREALRLSEWQLRSVINSASVILWAIDPDGVIRFIEGRALAKLGVEPGGLVGQSFFEVYADYPGITAAARRALDGEELTANVAYGENVFEVRYAPRFAPSGRVAGAIGVAVDVSERVRAEREREQLIAELERKNAELERFTYSVSHDLKSPLVTIRGFLGLVRQSAGTGNLEQLEADAQRIDEASERMLQILEELLELSRVGLVVKPPQHVSMTELVQRAVRLLGLDLEERGIAIEVQPNLPAVRGDSVRLLELVQNLLDNASRFLGDQVHPKIEVGARRGSDRVVFYVRDNGIGIAPRYQDKIFELFERLEADSIGTGVGLTLARRIASVHGGQLWVESEGEGHGSTFCFTLSEPSEPLPRV